MKKFVIAAVYLMALAGPTKATFAADCASDSSWFWKKRVYTELQNPEQAEADGYGVEVSEEYRRSLNPLDGTGITTRRTCSRVFFQQNKQRIWLEAQPVPGRLLVSSVRPEQHYVILQGLVGEKNPQNQIAFLNLTTGQRTTLASLQDSCRFQSVTPSPAGAYLALVTLQTGCGAEGVPDHVHVTLWNAAPQILSENGDYTLEPGSQVNWVSETTLTLSDGVTNVTLDVTAAQP